MDALGEDATTLDAAELDQLALRYRLGAGGITAVRMRRVHCAKRATRHRR